MKQNIIDTARKEAGIQARYEAAEAARDEIAMEQARAEHRALKIEILKLGDSFRMILDLYMQAQERGNARIDVSEYWQYRDEAALIAAFREYGIDSFTFSSTWSDAVHSAMEFTRNGCELTGMTEISTGSARWGKAEKRAAFIFALR